MKKINLVLNINYIYLALSMLVVMVFVSCKSESGAQTEKETVETIEEKVTEKIDWMTLEMPDQDGHGPDQDSDEFASVLVRKFCEMTPELFGKEPNLVVMNSGLSNSELKGDVDLIVNNNGSLLKTKVLIDGDKIGHDQSSDKEMDAEAVMVGFVSKILKDEGSSKNIDASTKMVDAIESEHQYMSLQANIMSILGVYDFLKTEELWKDFIHAETIGDWAEIMKSQL